jgi:hypothetical protein
MSIFLPIVLATIVIILIMWVVLSIIEGKPIWAFGRKSGGGITCPACGSKKTSLQVDKTAMSWYRAGRVVFNLNTVAHDVWRCRECNNIFKLQ